MTMNPIGKGLLNFKSKNDAEISAKSIFMFLTFYTQHTAVLHWTGLDEEE